MPQSPEKCSSPMQTGWGLGEPRTVRIELGWQLGGQDEQSHLMGIQHFDRNPNVSGKTLMERVVRLLQDLLNSRTTQKNRFLPAGIGLLNQHGLRVGQRGHRFSAIQYITY